MPSGILYGKTTTQISTGSFVQLRSTSVAATIGSPATIVSLKVYQPAGNNHVIQLDSDSSGTNTTFQSVIETGIPAAGQWLELGPVDPSRVWARSATSAGAIYWMVTWL